MGQKVDVDDLIDNQKFGLFSLRVLVLALIALIADGYDVQVMAFAAPGLAKAWHINRAAFGPVLSAGLFGILFGAPLFGWVGDRIGRKRCIVISSALYGLFCLACLTAHDLQTLTVLRFLTGVGLGGVLPNAIAIAAEMTPRRIRAGLTSFVGVGITLGGVIPGLIAARLAPPQTFHALFLVGGLAPIAIAVLIAVGMPESIAFLVQRGASRQRVVGLLHAIDPTVQIPEDAELVVRAPPSKADNSFARLFEGRMALVTPLLWVMFAATLLSIYLLTSWMPLLLEASGFAPSQAAFINSLFQMGGVLGVIVVSSLFGRLGAPLVAIMFVLTLGAVALVARGPLSENGVVLAVAACGFCLIGLQCIMNGTAGLAYPTAVRAKGVGMALGVGRIGSVVGPLIGGAMVASAGGSARDLFLVPLIPLALGAVAAVVVATRLNLRAPAGPPASAALEP